MNFNLNEFLSSLSNTLDAVEIDLFGIPTNHSKRIAYVSARIGHVLKLEPVEIFDLSVLSLMHDNGATIKILEDKINYTLKEKLSLSEKKQEHCTIGERNLAHFPFMTQPKNIILYHHENFDGSGFFGLMGEDIPLFSQIIHLADTLDLNFDMNQVSRDFILAFVKNHRNTYFSPVITDVFIDLSVNDEFWKALSDENIDKALKDVVPVFSNDLTYQQIRTMTMTLSRIIDAKSVFTQRHSSGLSNRMLKMTRFYHFDSTLRDQLLIASDLHDLGKLSISNAILDKPDKLTKEEFEEIKKHPSITRQCLQGLRGFENIALWCGNHHEKLDGSGYPQHLCGSDLDFQSRLLTCLDIYQALREKRPYRKAMKHDKALEIMRTMVIKGNLDAQIVDDIDGVFNRKQCVRLPYRNF